MTFHFIPGKKNTVFYRSFKMVFRTIGIGTALAAFLCLLQYFLAPHQWHLPAITGIGFALLWPWLFLMTMLSVFWWKKAMPYLLILFLAGMPFLMDTLAINRSKPLQKEKRPGALRVMSWNISGPQLGYKGKNTTALQQAIKEFIREWEPDILLLQDFGDISGGKYASNLLMFRDTLVFSYVQYVPWYKESVAWGNLSSGTIIFSKIPFRQAGAVLYPGRDVAEFITWADIEWPGANGKTARLATTHFQSMNLFTGYIPPGEVRYNQVEDSAIIQSRSFFNKLKFYQGYHGRQAMRLRQFTDSTPIPLIIGADLNSIPASYVYRKARGDLNDAFLEAGSGWGATFPYKIPWLRIDYLLHSPEILLQQYVTVQNNLSDHYPAVADFYPGFSEKGK